LSELKTLIKGDNKELIEAKTKELSELSGKIAEKAYAQQGGAEQPHAEQPHAKKDDGVVDAEFEEVKDKDK
jgi:molecular chaperone DnaK